VDFTGITAPASINIRINTVYILAPYGFVYGKGRYTGPYGFVYGVKTGPAWGGGGGVVCFVPCWYLEFFF
jgi:hypothetical protein